MRPIALILGFLLVLSSLHPGYRASGGAVVSELQPVGALPVGGEQAGRPIAQPDPDPASGVDDLWGPGGALRLSCLTGPAPGRGQTCPRPEPRNTRSQHPVRAPPFPI